MTHKATIINIVKSIVPVPNSRFWSLGIASGNRLIYTEKNKVLKGDLCVLSEEQESVERTGLSDYNPSDGQEQAYSLTRPATTT